MLKLVWSLIKDVFNKVVGIFKSPFIEVRGKCHGLIICRYFKPCFSLGRVVSENGGFIEVRWSDFCHMF